MDLEALKDKGRKSLKQSNADGASESGTRPMHANLKKA